MLSLYPIAIPEKNNPVNEQIAPMIPAIINGLAEGFISYFFV